MKPDQAPLLLLHGLTMSSTMWHPNVKELIKERCVKPKLRLLPCVFSAETLHSLSIPTLLVIGDQEATYSARKAINRAVGSMPNLTHHLLAGAGHLLTIEHADIVNALTLRFLNNEGRTDRE